MKRFCLALLTLLMFSSPAFADVVHLKNGTKIEGLIIEYWETFEVDGSDNFTVNAPKAKRLRETFEVQTENGDVHTVRREDVEKIVRVARNISQEILDEIGRRHPPPLEEELNEESIYYESDLLGTEVRFKAVSRKNPSLALGLSLLIPGTGQLYTGDYVDSSVHLFAATFGWDNYSRTKSKATLIGCVGIHIISAGKAMLKARRFNKNLIQLGHLIEIPKDRYTVGIDPINSHGKLGTRVALRF